MQLHPLFISCMQHADMHMSVIHTKKSDEWTSKRKEKKNKEAYKYEYLNIQASIEDGNSEKEEKNYEKY